MKQNRRSFLTTAGAGIAAALIPGRAEAAAINSFQSALIDSFQGKTAGLQFSIMTRSGQVLEHASGWARLPHSGVPMPMFSSIKYSVASVSKCVTAVAMLRALYDNPSVTMDDPIGPHLPAHWDVHTSFMEKVSFKHLLQHTSGIDQEWEVSYGALKGVAFGGANTTNLGSYAKGWDYTNTNYALMRLLIPKIAGMPVAAIPANASGSLLQSLEAAQALQYATYYMQYTQQKVWDKTGITPNMKCKPDAAYPGLSYLSSPYTLTNGTDFGDLTMVNASQGWNATATQLCAFIKTLHETQLMLPSWLSGMMAAELLGYDKAGNTKQGIYYWEKPGDYPASAYNGELHSRIFAYNNGVYLGLTVNSTIANPTPMIEAAFDSVTW